MIRDTLDHTPTNPEQSPSKSEQYWEELSLRRLEFSVLEEYARKDTDDNTNRHKPKKALSSEQKAHFRRTRTNLIEELGFVGPVSLISKLAAIGAI
jgi:hypothetical protein